MSSTQPQQSTASAADTIIQQQQSRNKNENNPDLYPDVSFSARPVIIMTTLDSSATSSTLPSSSCREELIVSALHDVIVRSLRRRLWKAFQEDDKETALRAYQATLSEFTQWLVQEEEHVRRRQRQAAAEAAAEQATVVDRNKNKRGVFLVKRRSLKEIETPSISNNNNNNNRLQHRSRGGSNRSFQANTTEGSLLWHCQMYQADLEKKFGGPSIPILETLMNPSEPFLADDFLSPYDRYDRPVRKELPDPVQHAAEQQALEDARLRRRRVRRPRVAFRRMLGREEDVPEIEVAPTATSGDSSGVEGNPKEDIYMTTPLHEAARLGAGDFVSFLLAQGGDPNHRNGLGRTALHTSAGGLTFEEAQLIQADKDSRETTEQISTSIDAVPVGIPATFLSDEILRLMHWQGADSTTASENKPANAGPSRGVLGRLFGTGHTKKGNTSKRDNGASKPQVRIAIKPDPERMAALTAERMFAALAILSWVQKDTGDGPSINAVDADGRTALHYASGMGRSDICMAILSDFRAMLTVVDDVGGRTPCEVASNQGYKELAAQLEARALLYMDPYGLDDDLMENLQAIEGETDPRKRLVPPFKWFETLSLKEVANERCGRVSRTRMEMSQVLEKLEVDKEMSSVSNSTESVPHEHCLEEKGNDRVEDGHKRDDHALNSCSAKQTFMQLQDSHVEAFLSFHKWDVSIATESFRKDGFTAFENANVSLPHCRGFIGKTSERLCQICYDDDISPEDWMNLQGCEHGFCKNCLSDYIQDCAKEKQSMYSISCPHHECSSIFAKHDIEVLLKDNPKSLRRLHEASDENFVAASSDFKFCPFPGCEGIVHRLPPSKFSSRRLDENLLDYCGATCVAVRDRTKIGDGATLTYEGVEDLEYNNCHSRDQPPTAHRFCFACGEGVHWPLTCERLEKWKEKIADEIGEVKDDEEEGDFNDLAQKMWIKANTRPCPSCNVNIEKNDGCNHMICSNPQCLHEFCWICRKDWKLHSNATGGFFRCNIWQEEDGEDRQEGRAEADPFNSTDEEGFGTAIYTAREAWKTRQEANRFIHHYTRWEAHAQSASLERQMKDRVCTRLAPVVEAAMAFDGSPVFNFGGQGLSFIHSAFTELLECRAVLQHSYAFSFFRYPTFSRSAQMFGHLYGKRKEKQNFERMQAELEILTEQMSDIVARSHLRATQVQISFLTAGAAEKRVELANMVFQIYKEEKKELERYKKRKENEEKYSANVLPNESSVAGVPGRSLSDLLTMHRMSREQPYDDSHLTGALDAFLARSNRVENGLNRVANLDEMASEAVRMWSCSQCTYMNDDGRQCAMCGGRR